MNEDHSDKNFPWSFYFNGEVMPKWGACWGLVGMISLLPKDREIFGIYCKIDHVGSIESADPDVFIYAIQEVLHILLSQRNAIFSVLAGQSYGQPSEIYSNLIEAAWRMRELTVTHRRAFWTSGDESVRAELVGTMQRCQLWSALPEDSLPPHILQGRREIRLAHEEQVKRLHQLAQSGQFDKDLRRRLYALGAP